MTCNVNGTIKELTYKVWDGDQYGGDFALELLQDGTFVANEKGEYEMNEEEYKNAVDYLRDEAKADNMLEMIDNSGNCEYHEATVFAEHEEVKQ